MNTSISINMSISISMSISMNISISTCMDISMSINTGTSTSISTSTSTYTIISTSMSISTSISTSISQSTWKMQGRSRMRLMRPSSAAVHPAAVNLSHTNQSTPVSTGSGMAMVTMVWMPEGKGEGRERLA